MAYDLTLTEEQEALIDAARGFARKEIIPVAGKLDEHGTFPREILKKAWETGLMNCEVPAAYGGGGLSCLEHCLILEESRNYSLERKTFGVPIAQHQAIQFMLAEMAIAYEATRLLCHKAAWMIDQGKVDSIV